MNQTIEDVRQVSQEVIEALKPIAQKLGEGAEAIYKMAVKDAIITGVEHGLYMVSGTLLLFFPLLIWQVIKKKEVPERPDSKDPVMIAKFERMYREATNHAALFEGARAPIMLVAVTVCCLIGLCIINVNLGTTLHYLFNPEYMALKELLSSIKH